MEGKTDFTFKTSLNLPYEAAIEKVTEELKKEGFGVLTEVDVKATLKKKLDVDFRRYSILGACNPNLAHQALETELDIGALLPCNVIVYEEGNGSVVGIVDPISMLGVVDNPELEAVADEALSSLKRVHQSLNE